MFVSTTLEDNQYKAIRDPAVIDAFLLKQRLFYSPWELDQFFDLIF